MDGNLNRLEPYCREHGVPFRRLGKLLVATDGSQIGKLRELQENGRKNGVRTGCLHFSQCPCAARGGSLLSGGPAEIDQPLSLGPMNDVQLCSAPDLLCCSNRGLMCFYCLMLRTTPCNESLAATRCSLQVHLEWLEREEAIKMEPHLHCVAALWSPNTAIVDSHRSVHALYHQS